MKKTLALVLGLLTILMLAINTAAASPEVIKPLWNNINYMSNDLEFNSTSGITSTMVLGKSGTTKITGTLTVYVQTANGWEVVDSASTTSNSNIFTLDINFTGIPGEYYKSVLSVTVMINGLNESATKTAYEYCPSTN